MNKRSVKIVFDVEGVVDEQSDGPFPLGLYAGGEEDVIFYIDGLGSRKAAPQDCVVIKDVEVEW